LLADLMLRRHGGAHKVTFKEAAWWSVAWVALAVDSIFVFLMIFTCFAVPEEQRQKVLIIGVLGASVLRAIIIFVGGMLLAKFHWILYVFGALPLLTGIKMLLVDVYKIPVLWLLAVVAATIGATVVLSLLLPPKDKAQPEGRWRVEPCRACVECRGCH